MHRQLAAVLAVGPVLLRDPFVLEAGVFQMGISKAIVMGYSDIGEIVLCDGFMT